MFKVMHEPTQLPEDQLHDCATMAQLIGVRKQAIYAAMQAGHLRFILRRGDGPVRVRKTTLRWVQDYLSVMPRPWHEGDRCDISWRRKPDTPLPPGVWE